MTGFIGRVRSVVLEVILHVLLLDASSFKKNNKDWVCISIYSHMHPCLRACTCAFVILRVYVCANKPSSVLNHSGEFVYPGSGDVKTPSALNGQTKRTHLAEIKQKLS